LLSRNVKSTINNTNGHGDISKMDNEVADMIPYWYRTVIDIDSIKA